MNNLLWLLIIWIFITGHDYRMIVSATAAAYRGETTELSGRDSGGLHTSPLLKPWEDPLRPIIIDAYHLNTIDWDQIATDNRMLAIVHKASEGFKKDPAYEIRKKKAREMGYKWGSYHLGRAGKAVEQADFYLNCVNDLSEELLALDLESPDGRKYMSLDDAMLFIERIYEQTCRYPVVYGNHSVVKSIAERYGKESVFSNCALWYARFSRQIKDFDSRTWPTYSLWQFSSEINCRKTGECLYNVPGTRYDMDVNVYNGSAEELNIKWPEI